jgi:hypothetical protein
MSADPRAPEYKEGIDQSPDQRERKPMPASRARAGVTGHNVRYVLAFGLVAVVLAFLIIYLVYFA